MDAFLFMCYSIAEKGEIALARVLGPYFPECISDLPSRDDILLPSSGQTEGGGLVIYVDIQRK